VRAAASEGGRSECRAWSALGPGARCRGARCIFCKPHTGSGPPSQALRIEGFESVLAAHKMEKKIARFG